MVAKDILRLVLLVLFVAFAIWSGSRTRLRGSIQIKSSPEREEEARLMLRRLKNTRDSLKQEQKGYEIKNGGKDIPEFHPGVNLSSGTALPIITLLLLLF